MDVIVIFRSENPADIKSQQQQIIQPYGAWFDRTNVKHDTV